MKKITLNKFNAGIINDPRSNVEGGARMVTNFDILTDPHKLSPYRDTESGDSGASTSQKQNFCIAHWLPGSTNDWRIFSLGVVSGTGRAEILMKQASTVPGSTDLTDAGWLTPSNNQSASGSTNFNLFVFYKKTGLIYGAKAGTTIWAFDAATAGAFNDSARSLSYTNIAQGLVHSKDDILYIPYDNKIAKNNNGTWTDVAITLPSDMYITSICEYGNYLAIACAPLSGIGHSRVFLWDRDSSLETLSESIDWGEEILQVIEEVDGVLVGISYTGAGTTRFKDRIIFRYLSVSSAIKFQELVGTATAPATTLRIAKQKVNNRVYFLLTAPIAGSTREGVWSVGRSGPNSPMSVVHEYTPNNDTAVYPNGSLRNFIIVGDYLLLAYVNSSSSYAVSKSNDQSSFTATSIWESLINPGMDVTDRAMDKQLMSVGLTYDPLPAAGQVVLKYKVDGGSWVTVFTETTDGATRTEPYTLTAAGTEFTAGEEYEFRIESTGGAVITGLTYKYQVKNSN